MSIYGEGSRTNRQWIAAALAFGLLVAGWIITGRRAVRAQEEATPAPQLTIEQCFEDMEYLRILNRIEPTPEQLGKAVEIISAFELQRQQREIMLSQSAPQTLIEARAALLRGEAGPSEGEEELLGEDLTQQWALAEQALWQARQQTVEQLKTVFTEEQLRRFARAQGPLRRVDDLMAELAISRGLPDEQWLQWQQRVVPGLVELIIDRGPENVKAPFEVASKFLEEARALSDEEFSAQKDALTQKLEQLVLAADFEPEEEDAQPAERLVWFLLERPRSAIILKEMAQARGGAY